MADTGIKKSKAYKEALPLYLHRDRRAERHFDTNRPICIAREDLFLVNVVRNHVLTLNFIPGTESYLQYGSSTINLKLSDEETLLLQANLFSKPPKERSAGW